jgi:hypothetical protein
VIGATLLVNLATLTGLALTEIVSLAIKPWREFIGGRGGGDVLRRGWTKCAKEVQKKGELW